jgi:hypothetical protein
MEGTKPVVMNMEGARPLTGPALPNLINAVSMLKVKVKSALANAEINKLVLTLTF